MPTINQPSASDAPEHLCPACGARIRENDRFCLSCGNAVAPSPVVPDLPAPPEQSSRPTPAAMKPERFRFRAWMGFLLGGAFLLGVLLGVFALPDGRSQATARPAQGAAASVPPVQTPEPAESDAPEQTDAAPKPEPTADGTEGEGGLSPLVRLPAEPDSRIAEACSASDTEYLEGELTDYLTAGKTLVASVTTVARPYTFAFGFKSGDVQNGLMAVVIVEYSNGRTVATSTTPVFYADSLPANEPALFAFDITELEYAIEADAGGSLPISNNGVDIMKLIDNGKVSVLLVSGGAPIATGCIMDNTTI